MGKRILRPESISAVTRRKHEGWDTAGSPKSRQGKSRGRGRVRTTDLPVSKLMLQRLESS
ncbi:hypothetical protein T265_03873 [Opisthorchis viverrini]|uniref:Uncharacterized protein n=1 Tax=Opisthorchis viverrini TaxID=6198 RepID=A0A074ZPZ2_OPIVI|nr:hypothetical protein T265_03873 [Opisthorchis viverrini]KER29493.1 hypothetical protein T265_03873 [Opisthorchis viverrini]